MMMRIVPILMGTLILASAQSGCNRDAPRSSGPPVVPPADISAEVPLTIVSPREAYEPIEPIKLQVALTNLSRSDITYNLDDLSDCEVHGFSVRDLRRDVEIEDATPDAGSWSKRFGGSRPGPMRVRPGETRGFSATPNLCLDMTAPSLYSIAVTMKIVRTADGRPCITRSEPIHVAVTPRPKDR